MLKALIADIDFPYFYGRKQGDHVIANIRVSCAGLTLVSEETTIFQLPENARPKNTIYFPMTIIGATGLNIASGKYCILYANGNVTIPSTAGGNQIFMQFDFFTSL